MWYWTEEIGKTPERGRLIRRTKRGAAHQGTANLSRAPSRFCTGVPCLLTASHTTTALRNVEYIQYLTKGQDPQWQFRIAPPLFV